MVLGNLIKTQYIFCCLVEVPLVIYILKKRCLEFSDVLGMCSIGSLGEEKNEGPVRNITVKSAVFTGSDNGLRIKTYARPNAGSVSGVLFQDIVMRNAKNPIIIDQNYCDGGCSGQVSLFIVANLNQFSILVIC